LQGRQGIQGPQGLQGLQGLQGIQGIAGVSARTTVFKTSDETITNDATLNNDSQLFFTVAANTTYQFRLEVLFDSGSTPDFKYRHSGPANPTLVRITQQDSPPGSTTLTYSVATAFSAADVVVNGGAVTNGGYVKLTGIIQNGANAGTFRFQWAQNNSSGTATTVRAGSYVEYAVVA
jgi:hypothetical protein